MSEFLHLCGSDSWPASEGEGDPISVRWVIRELRGEHQWTRWHYTEGNALHTACGRAVQLMTADNSPQTGDLIDVNCRSCAAIMENGNDR